MLHAVSWISFFKWMLFCSLIYYVIIISIIFGQGLRDYLRRRKKLLVLGPALLGFAVANAQDGNQGISQANTMIRGYFDTGTQLMYGIGAIVALVGAVKVFRHWNDHDNRDVQKAAAAWFGSCIFLVIVATVIRSFFGL